MRSVPPFGDQNFLCCYNTFWLLPLLFSKVFSAVMLMSNRELIRLFISPSSIHRKQLKIIKNGSINCSSQTHQLSVQGVSRRKDFQDEDVSSTFSPNFPSDLDALIPLEGDFHPTREEGHMRKRKKKKRRKNHHHKDQNDRDHSLGSNNSNSNSTISTDESLFASGMIDTEGHHHHKPQEPRSREYFLNKMNQQLNHRKHHIIRRD